MKDIVIIHNLHDKTSRDFIALHGSRNDVVVVVDDGHDVRLAFPYISAFPTIVIPTPAYTSDPDENGNTTSIPASIEYLRAPEDWSKVEERINYWETKVPNWKATDSRYK